MKTRIFNGGLTSGKRDNGGGQAMVEYLVATGVLAATMVMFALFLYVFREYGVRILDLVASEYP
jgi:hypothetical protein